MTVTSFNYTPGQFTAIAVWPVCALVRLPSWDPMVSWAYAALTNDPRAQTVSQEFFDATSGSQPSIGVLSVETDGIVVMAQGQVKAFVGDEPVACPPEGVIVDAQPPVSLLADGAESMPVLPLAYGIVPAGRIGVGWTPYGTADWQTPPGQPNDVPSYDPGTQAAGRPQAIERADLIAALLCPAGHANPVFASRCRICKAPLVSQAPVWVPRPPLGVLRSSIGLELPLDGCVVIGRNPQPIASMPQAKLVRLNDPGLDISSQHLAVDINDWIVSVTDLGSTNGTQVIVPGYSPVALRANEPMVIEPGTTVVLAHVFDMVFEAQ